ncbi:hypothetical protein QOZ95_001683 [Paenibacillus brasilensis]|uniref:Uncharacterized protein n=1 Tax=Paenibacillus brasilensis TaxID=128574 RepID=A0ABU0KY79_9BACL|nr:hypothetical protein [Paenibacillus brasilensis]
MTDFSAITTFLEVDYSDRGPEPRDPVFLFRSYIVLLMTNPEMELTEWINEMTYPEVAKSF